MNLTHRVSLVLIFATVSGIAVSAHHPDRTRFGQAAIRQIFRKMHSEYREEISAKMRPVTLRTKIFGKKSDDGATEIVGGKVVISVMPTNREYRTARQIGLTLCHELGHYLGGSPIDHRDSLTFEGQADYFAFAKCLKRLWKDDDNQAAVLHADVPPLAERRCREVYAAESDVWLCVRSIVAAQEVAVQYYLRRGYTGEGIPSIEVRAPYKSGHGTAKNPSAYDGLTNPWHASPQCRLDTMVAGALCDIDPKIGFSETDEFAGACAYGTVGGRPECWYVPGKHPYATEASGDKK